jgi:4-amino-4-deoxy-L-arabinose transferase-like glycosyltransferase
MLALYSLGGAGVWREWFLDNQLGRFFGRTVYLGHLHGPFYYLGVVPLVLMPWTPVIAGWIVHRQWKELSGNETGIQSLLRVAVAWSFGGLLVLSLASTKREIYLYPLLPGFAIITATCIDRPPKWVGEVLWIMSMILCAIMACLAVVTPAWTGQTVRLTWGIKPCVGICAIVGLLALMSFKKNLLAQVTTVTGLFYLAAMWSLIPIIDRDKSYGPPIRSLVESIPHEVRNRICGWNLDETTRALLPYYCDLTVTNVRDTIWLERILKGADQGCAVVITDQRRFPPPNTMVPPWTILAQERLGVNRRLLLIAGKSDTEGQR